jgi:putative FmdB family regulatory protein
MLIKRFGWPTKPFHHPLFDQEMVSNYNPWLTLGQNVYIIFNNLNIRIKHMPIFEYVCEECGDCFEKLQKSEEEYPDECPKCGSNSLKRKLSSFAATGASAECFSGG